jgi:hypothetical protein
MVDRDRGVVEHSGRAEPGRYYGAPQAPAAPGRREGGRGDPRPGPPVGERQATSGGGDRGRSTGTQESAQHRAGRAKPKWWRRPWVVPLALICVIFIAFSAPPYFMFDHTKVWTITFRPGLESFHYALVSVHVAFGIIALLACCVQVWPWFRRKFPVVHR